MEAFFIYFLKICVASGVMFGYYQLFLKDKTFHHYNRFYLLSTFAVSLLLPLMKVEYFTVEQDNKLYFLLNGLQNFKNIKTQQDDFPYFRIIAFLAGLGAVFFLIRFAIGLLKIRSLQKIYPKQYFEGISFYQTDLSDAPFSFFKNLFWKRSIGLDSEAGKQILRHEMVHIEQKHTIDKVFAETITAVFWFNPFFWLIKKEINLLHEYLADKKALKNMDTKAFAQMLLASHFSGKVLPATSPFLSSNLKKRLTMLKKSKTKFAYARKILALPIVFLLAFAYLVNAKNKEIKESNNILSEMISNILPGKNIKVYYVDAKEVSREEYESYIWKHGTLGAISLMMPYKTKNGKKGKVFLHMAGEQKYYPNSVVNRIAEDYRINHPELNIPYEQLLGEEHEKSQKQDTLKNDNPKKDAGIESQTGFEKMDASKEFQKNAKRHQPSSEEQKFLNSKEYKEMMAEAAKAGEEGRKAAAEAAKESVEALEYVNSPEFKKVVADARKSAREAAAYVNSAEFKKEVADAQKSAKEMDKFKEAVKKEPIVANNSTKAQDEQMLKMRKNAKEPKYYLDGKEISKKELDAFDVQKIESINVEKKDGEGFIYIKSKK